MVAYLHEAKIPVTPSTTAAFHVDHGYGDARDAIEYAERLADAGADEIMHKLAKKSRKRWPEFAVAAPRLIGT